jgi:hypothetical protein
MSRKKQHKRVFFVPFVRHGAAPLPIAYASLRARASDISTRQAILCL